MLVFQLSREETLLHIKVRYNLIINVYIWFKFRAAVLKSLAVLARPIQPFFPVSLQNFVIKSVIQLGLFGFLHTNNFRDNRAKLSLTSVV